jgi:hypothetical protein
MLTAVLSIGSLGHLTRPSRCRIMHSTIWTLVPVIGTVQEGWALMKALMWGGGSLLALEDVSEPEPGPGEEAA